MAKPELRDHRKFLKLRRLLGEPAPHVLGYLEYLWSRGYQTGSPVIGDSDDVEAAAEYPGEAGKFTNAAAAAGFIDEDGQGTFVIHDLYEHAPDYVKKRMVRRGTAPNGVRQAMKRREVAEDGRLTAKDGEATAKDGEATANCGVHNQEPRTKNQEPRTKNQEPRNEREEKKEAEPHPTPAKRFTPPTVDEVAAYCLERREKGNRVDPAKFVDFYESKGWRVGNQPMRCWKSCVRTWENRDFTRAPPAQTLATVPKPTQMPSAEKVLEIMNNWRPPSNAPAA